MKDGAYKPDYEDSYEYIRKSILKNKTSRRKKEVPTPQIISLASLRSTNNKTSDSLYVHNKIARKNVMAKYLPPRPQTPKESMRIFGDEEMDYEHMPSVNDSIYYLLLNCLFIYYLIEKNINKVLKKVERVKKKKPKEPIEFMESINNIFDYTPPDLSSGATYKNTIIPPYQYEEAKSNKKKKILMNEWSSSIYFIYIYIYIN